MVNGPGRKSLKTDAVAAELRRRIAEGQYPPHSYIPAERDLAEELGVGRPTVRAAIDLLEKEHLVIQTRGRGTRVLPPLDRLGNRVIAILRGYRPHFPRKHEAIAAAIEEEFMRQGYDYEIVTNMMATDKDGERVLAPVTASMLSERYGAVISVETGLEDIPLELERTKFPMVVAGLQAHVPLSGTWTDLSKSARHAVATLVALGHRRIAFVGREPELLNYGDARNGYIQGMQDAHIAVDESLIITAPQTESLSAYLAARPLLEKRPTGIVAARDIFAHGVYHLFSDAGLAIGRDYSLIGFDDLSWQEEEPFLTTFREPCHEMGRIAAQMLIERIVSGWRPVELREVEASFVLRRSAGPVPQPDSSHDTKNQRTMLDGKKGLDAQTA